MRINMDEFKKSTLPIKKTNNENPICIDDYDGDITIDIGAYRCYLDYEDILALAEHIKKFEILDDVDAVDKKGAVDILINISEMHDQEISILKDKFERLQAKLLRHDHFKSKVYC